MGGSISMRKFDGKRSGGFLLAEAVTGLVLLGITLEITAFFGSALLRETRQAYGKLHRAQLMDERVHHVDVHHQQRLVITDRSGKNEITW